MVWCCERAKTHCFLENHKNVFCQFIIRSTQRTTCHDLEKAIVVFDFLKKLWLLVICDTNQDCLMNWMLQLDTLKGVQQWLESRADSPHRLRECSVPSQNTKSQLHKTNSVNDSRGSTVDAVQTPVCKCQYTDSQTNGQQLFLQPFSVDQR